MTTPQVPTVDARYADLLSEILDTGDELKTRNSVCKRIFGVRIRFTSTPLIGARTTAWKNALREWEWFMSGSNNIADLHPKVHHWWRPWADADGRIANNYSVQFRDFAGHTGTVDQVRLLIDGIRDHPASRRNVATTWNTADMVAPETLITNCHHTLVQAFVRPDNTLHHVVYQRSADVVCGLGANWIQAWAFMLWLAGVTGRKPGTLTWLGGDVHVYETHYDLAEKIIAAAPQAAPTPDLVYDPVYDPTLAVPTFRECDFRLAGEYRPVITEKAVMVV